LYHYGPATIWVSGPVGGTWWATVKFSHSETDLDARSYDELMDQAKDFIDGLPELQGFSDPRSKAKAIETYGKRTRGELGEAGGRRGSAGLPPLPSNTLIQFPSGRWGFVGRVDARLMYASVDGGPLSPEVLDEIARSSNPAMTLKLRGGKRLAWDTKEEAEAARDALVRHGMAEARRRAPPARAPFVPDEDEALFTDPASIERFIDREIAKHGDVARDSFRFSADDAAKLAKKYEDDVRAQDRAYPGANAGKEFAAQAVLIRKSEALLRKAAKGHGVGEAPKKKAKAKAKKRSRR
jgi:hypothetical protein